MSSCGNPANTPVTQTNYTLPNDMGYGNSLNMVIIDNCEYFCTRTYGGAKTLCHKGNCKFCQKRAAMHDTVYISSTKPVK